MINRKQLFDIAWRAALFALPWQTRWILSTPTIGGTPWEQGTIAIYASWVLMVFAVIVGTTLSRGSSRAQRSGAEGPLLIGVGLLIVVSFFTSSPIATALWWVHLILLSAFAWTLWKNNVTRMELAQWFVIALMPEVILGIWQFLQQKVDGATILGIANQRAWMRGVSVVEYGEYRIMRAYAGFPHPNVFGGWLAIGATLLPAFIASAKKERDAFVWIACGALMIMALVFSFSRGAWIAAAVGAAISFFLSWKQTTEKSHRDPLRIAAFVFFAVAALSAYSQWEAVVTRFQATAILERWSVEQRVTSLHDGLSAFLHRPIFGWGPGAALAGIDNLHHAASPSVPGFGADGSMVQFRAPLEPPHAAPLAALVETGVVGFLAIVLLIWLLLKYLWQSKQFIAALPVLASAAVLSVTDHYLWTLWAGQALLMVIYSYLMA